MQIFCFLVYLVLRKKISNSYLAWHEWVKQPKIIFSYFAHISLFGLENWELGIAEFVLSGQTWVSYVRKLDQSLSGSSFSSLVFIDSGGWTATVFTPIARSIKNKQFLSCLCKHFYLGVSILLMYLLTFHVFIEYIRKKQCYYQRKWQSFCTGMEEQCNLQ
jgi:uncharacterized membrane protein